MVIRPSLWTEHPKKVQVSNTLLFLSRMSSLIFWWKTYPLYFQGQVFWPWKVKYRRPLPPKEAIVPHHCWHFLGYSTAIPIQLVNSSQMVSALEIKSYCFLFPVSCIAANWGKKSMPFVEKPTCWVNKEANSQALWWISHTTSYVDIRDFWVQKQTPQKAKDFWLKKGAIRWSIFLERPLNASGWHTRWKG